MRIPTAEGHADDDTGRRVWAWAVLAGLTALLGVGAARQWGQAPATELRAARGRLVDLDARRSQALAASLAITRQYEEAGNLEEAGRARATLWDRQLTPAEEAERFALRERIGAAGRPGPGG